MGKASRKKSQSRQSGESASHPLPQNTPWYESNLFWAPASICVAIILSVLAVMKDLRWLLWVGWCCSWPSAWCISKNLRSPFLRWGACSFTIILVGIGLYALSSSLETKKETPPAILKELTIAVFMECHLISLPANVPPQSTLHVIALNRKHMERENWGFYQIPNDSEKSISWPDKTKLELSKKLKNFGAFGYSCEITNSGNESIVHLAVPIDVWFASDKKAINYRPIVSSLGVGKSFTFHIVNDCPVNVAAAWQDIPTKVTILGESVPRQIILKRKYKNPAEQIMMFLPSQVSWVRQLPCE